MLYFPGLPTSPYFERSLFSWLADLERRTDAVVRSCSRSSRTASAERVFVSDDAERLGLAGRGEAASWNGFYFFRHGERRSENHALCPRTSAALDALPLVRIRANAPEVMFSVLTPGSHILPHRGVTNTRVVALPLVVAEDARS